MNLRYSLLVIFLGFPVAMVNFILQLSQTSIACFARNGFFSVCISLQTGQGGSSYFSAPLLDSHRLQYSFWKLRSSKDTNVRSGGRLIH